MYRPGGSLSSRDDILIAYFRDDLFGYKVSDCVRFVLILNPDYNSRRFSLAGDIGIARGLDRLFLLWLGGESANSRIRFLNSFENRLVFLRKEGCDCRSELAEECPVCRANTRVRRRGKSSRSKSFRTSRSYFHG